MAGNRAYLGTVRIALIVRYTLPLLTASMWTPSCRYSYSVQTKGGIRRGILEQVLVVYRELQWELWASSLHLWRSVELWKRVLISLTAFAIGLHVHYVAQWVWLAVFLTEPTTSLHMLPPIGVTYDTQQMSQTMEMGTVAAGPVATLFDTIVLVLAACTYRTLWNRVPKFFSDFVDAFCIYSIISPALVAAYDVRAWVGRHPHHRLVSAVSV